MEGFCPSADLPKMQAHFSDNYKGWVPPWQCEQRWGKLEVGEGMGLEWNWGEDDGVGD